MEKKHSLSEVFRWLLGPVLVAVFACSSLIMAERLQGQQNQEGLKQLEDAIHKAVMTCYTTEGIYPPTIMYIEENYGIQIDKKKYTVFYEIFADNIMPEITVLPKG
ncbi:MAG: hypothetical protein ACOCM4_01630 [Acetivibrio ethanolgignens]